MDVGDWLGTRAVVWKWEKQPVLSDRDRCAPTAAYGGCLESACNTHCNNYRTALDLGVPCLQTPHTLYSKRKDAALREAAIRRREL